MMPTEKNNESTTPCISYGWVCAYLENPADFPQAVDRLELSVIAHATTHTHKRCAQFMKDSYEIEKPNSDLNYLTLGIKYIVLFIVLFFGSWIAIPLFVANGVTTRVNR